MARVEAWYAEVKRRSDWSDYALDYEFAWTEEGRESRLPEDDRPRTFEWIRKESRKPRGRDRRWRNMEELVRAVEQDPQFSGTQPLYEAEIWRLVQETSPTPDTVQERIGCLLEANRLVQVPIAEALAGIGPYIGDIDPPSIFDRCLRLSLRQMDEFSRIALAWSLYLFTEPAHNAPFRAKVLSIADDLLDHFFARYLPGNHFGYYRNAINALLQGHLDLSVRAISGYGSIETMGKWPIIPDDLYGKLTEIQLFPELAVMQMLDSFGQRSGRD